LQDEFFPFSVRKCPCVDNISSSLLALITVRATLPPSGLPLGLPWWTQRRWR
jgi:hypothetical protein